MSVLHLRITAQGLGVAALTLAALGPARAHHTAEHSAAATAAPSHDDGQRAQWPAWLRTRVRQLEAGPVAHSASSVWQLTHRGQSAYFFVAPCCDQFNPLHDGASGRLLCHPSGGIAAQGDGKCPNPVDAGTVPRFVWAHPKSPQALPLPVPILNRP